MIITDKQIAELGFIHYDQMGESAFLIKKINESLYWKVHCYSGVFQTFQLIGGKGFELNFKPEYLFDIKEIMRVVEKDLIK